MGMSMFWDFGSLYHEALRRPPRKLLRQRQTVSVETLRRPGCRLLRQRQIVIPDLFVDKADRCVGQVY